MAELASTSGPGATAAAQDTAPAAEMTQRRVPGLAVPIIGERMLQTLVGAVDTLIVASLGATALAGVGIASEIVFLMLSTTAAVSAGGTGGVAHAVGARDTEAASHLARQPVVWGPVLAVPLTTLGYAPVPMLIGVFQATPDVTDDATTYLRITAGGMVVIVMTFVFGDIFKGAGDGTSPMYASLADNVVNVGASYVLIFGELGLPRPEVAGSAWGSVIGRSVVVLILLWILMSGRRWLSIARRHGWRPTLDAARSLAHIGIPAALEGMVTNVGVTTLVLVVALIGTDALAAQQIIFTALSLALRWSLVWMIAAGAVYFLLAATIIGAFTDDRGVIAGRWRDDGAGLSLPFWAYQSVFGGALRALGDAARTPMLTNIAATWLGVGLAWAGVLALDASLTFAWTAMLITSPIMLLTMPVFRRRLADRRAMIAADMP